MLKISLNFFNYVVEIIFWLKLMIGVLLYFVNFCFCYLVLGTCARIWNVLEEGFWNIVLVLYIELKNIFIF